MSKFIKIISKILGGLIIIVVVLAGLLWATTLQPAKVETEAIHCPENAPTLEAGQSLKLMTYNIQYMAGKNYYFWYEGGEDKRPSTEDIALTTEKLAQFITTENPEVIFLQEVDDGSKRVDGKDQLADLLAFLPDEYQCYTEAFYWQAKFVPHPRIMGAIGQKVAIISKYKLEDATRYQLPIAPHDPVTRQLSPKRAFLEVTLPGEQTDLVLMTTHLEVPEHGQALKQAEIAQLLAHIQMLEGENQMWILGGDFNLLPPGQYENLPASEGGHSQSSFRQETELLPLLEAYQMVPDLTQLQEPTEQDWYTMFLNDPEVTEPSHTVDYFFYPDELKVTESYVPREQTLTISDHLPVVAIFTLPDTKD